MTPSRIKLLAHRLPLAACAAALGVAAALVAPAASALDKVKIGVVLPKAQLGQGATGQDVAEPVRASLVSYLAGPAIEIVKLQARIPAQVDAEAKEAGVQYVLYTTVTQKKAGGGMSFGKLMGAVGAVAPIAASVPGVSALGGSYKTAVIAQQAAVAAQGAAQAAAQQEAVEAQRQLSQAQGAVNKGDQITLEYTLSRVGESAPVATKQSSGKAQQAGEDVLAPLLEAAAGEVLAAAK